MKKKNNNNRKNGTHANIRDDKAVSDDYFDDCIGFICAITMRTSRARSCPHNDANEYLPARNTPHDGEVCVAYVMLFI